ncbi:hypothetical protein ACLIYP_29770 [Streptomyces nanhaiensis]
MPHHAAGRYQPPADVPSVLVLMPVLGAVAVAPALFFRGRR